MTNKLSVHRALVELKTIDKRITRGIEGKRFIGYKDKDGKVDKYKPSNDFEVEVKADFDSVTDLIKRKTDIKNALILSNSVTKIKIGETEYTVAEAIAIRDTVAIKRQLLNELKRQYRTTTAIVKQTNEDAVYNAESKAENAFADGGDKNSIDKKANAFVEMVEMLTKNNSVEVVDPLELETKIDKMENEIDEFEANIDAVLSESNALTTIEF